MPRSIALGFFDGLHIAHMEVLRAAAAYKAQGLRPAVLLFSEHPQVVLGGTAPPMLLTDEARDTMLAGLGYEILRLPFRDVMSLPPERFFHEVLLGHFGAKALSCGFHYHFGKGAAGSPALLQPLCAQNQIALTVVPKVVYQNAPISSTRIRAALACGNIAVANAMLGRPFGYDFAVVVGDQLGRTLGAPTLNQLFPEGFAVPRFGVYSSETFVEGQWRASITNIGRRPTVQGAQLRSETHILAFSGNLYAQRVPVRLLCFLREERRFISLEALKGQIALDVFARGEMREGIPCE
ncbi:MAG: riboflavin biosynthesis protein RibF [Oscillospiraceae bacterium]|jgi:riboflavin kinase/FMN adenylyltransferase|nr:riboflavin biosynthesis protein RibF [Oscillospiraceae bacterium]